MISVLLSLFLWCLCFSTSTTSTTTFNVTFTTPTLGLKLSKHLVVQEKALVNDKIIRIGDTLVSVNTKKLQHLSLNQALHLIRDASSPKVLEFSSHHVQSSVTPANAKAQLRVFDIDQGLLGTVPFQPAKFGTWTSASLCVPHRVAFAAPVHACTALDAMARDQLRGKIAVVQRGSCSFLAKAWQVFLNGAVGIIVINNEENVLAMPSESEQAAFGLNIPAVMVRKSAQQLLRSAHRNGSHVQMFDNTICGGIHSRYGTVDATHNAIQADIEAMLHIELDNNANVVMEDPMHRGGSIVFSFPGAEKLVGEFLQFSTGPRELPARSVRIVWVEPVGGCTALDASLIPFTVETNWFAIIERGHGCSFALKIQHATNAGASGIIIANDMAHGMTHGKVGGKIDKNNEQHKIPAIMISLATARDLRRLSQEHADGDNTVVPTGRMALVIKPIISALWHELGELADVRGWPTDARDRRKVWKRMSKRHHPDKATGSEERFEWLRYLYEATEKKKDLF